MSSKILQVLLHSLKFLASLFHFLIDFSLYPRKAKKIRQIFLQYMISQYSQSLDDTWQENYREELALMVQSGKRAEIEALYFHGYDYLGKHIAKKIVQANYI